MKSSVINVKRDADNLSDILSEVQKSASYADLDTKKHSDFVFLPKSLSEC